MKWCFSFVLGLTSLPLVAATHVVMLCVDDLRPDLGCYGVPHASTPHIDKLAAGGRIFSRHYVQAPTCGASRYALLTGLYGPRGNDALMSRAKHLDPKRPSLPEVFRQAGFTTVAVGKISHHPGGLGGKNWNDPQVVEMPGAWDRQPLNCGPWRHPEGLMHGLADGAVRGKTPYPACESKVGPDSIYPDGRITATAMDELRTLAAAGKPFFLAVGWIRPHLPFGAPQRWHDIHQDTPLPPISHPERPKGLTTWHESGEFRRYDHGGLDPNKDADYADRVRRHYAACVSYADAQVGQVMDLLAELGLDRNTVVVLWGDHGYHLGEHAVWGKHTLFEESLRAPLIVRHPGIAMAGATSAAVVETIDLFPTLCGLAGIETPKFLPGVSLQPQLKDPAVEGRAAVSYDFRRETLRTPRYRLVRHQPQKGKPPAFELYDHESPEGETRNLADSRPSVVAELVGQLDARLAESP